MKRTFTDKESILLVNITRLGDMLQATPTIAGMKLENPNAKITVLVEKQFEEICHSLPGIDEVMPIDLGMTVRSLAREGEGIIDAYEYVTEFVESLRAKNFDFCLNMSSSAYTALLLKLVGVKRNGGWVSDEEGNRVIASEWARLFATSVFHQNRQFNSLNLVDVFRCSADVEQHPHALQFTMKDDAISYAETLISEAKFSNIGPIVAIQAGASQGKRQWETARFSQLIRRLVKNYNARVILVGTKKELPLIEPIANGADCDNIFIAAGRTSIPQLAALLKLSDILVTGDTGTMHVSVAAGTPVVAMFLASAFGFETGPYSEGNLVLQPVIGCGPCNPNKPCIGLECHDLIDPDLLADLTVARANGDFKTLPSHLADKIDCNKMVVYRSTFDENGFCDLIALNPGTLDGHRKYRDAYRKLWLDELGGYPAQEIAAAEPVKKCSLVTLDDALSGMQRVSSLAEEGVRSIGKLKSLITNLTGAPKELGDVNAVLNNLDREIEELGYDQPPLGPVTRMFVFAKENLSGSDPLLLASQMGRAYEDLARRSLKLGRLVNAVS